LKHLTTETASQCTEEEWKLEKVAASLAGFCLWLQDPAQPSGWPVGDNPALPDPSFLFANSHELPGHPDLLIPLSSADELHRSMH
jgi:hypothetical protein